MSRWALKDKDGKYRSRRAFKQDCNNDSEEPWEIRRKKGSGGVPSMMESVKKAFSRK